MKHIAKIFFVVILLAAGPLCFGTEPNDSPDINCISLMERIAALEQRLSALEDRISQIETRRPTPVPKNPNIAPGSPVDPNKDALRIERLNKQIQDAKNAIELDEGRIQSLPPQYFSGGLYKLRQKDVPELMRSLDTAKENCKLLSNQERNYNKILQLVKKNPDLGLDAIEAEQKLIECQGRNKKADQNLERIRALIEYNRELFNIVPK
jgi:hypothetical protein